MGILSWLFGTRKDTTGDPRSRYKPAGPVMSTNESYFYARLLQAAPGYNVLAKVRLADIVTVSGVHDKEWFEMYAKVAQKHIDFVLCDSRFVPVCLIELDDASHRDQQARKRDQEKDYACSKAGIPLLRYKAQRSYAIHDIRAFLNKHGIT